MKTSFVVTIFLYYFRSDSMYAFSINPYKTWDPLSEGGPRRVGDRVLLFHLDIPLFHYQNISQSFRCISLIPIMMILITESYAIKKLALNLASFGWSCFNYYLYHGRCLAWVLASRSHLPFWPYHFKSLCTYISFFFLGCLIFCM